MAEHLTVVKKVVTEVDDFKALWKNRRWLAVFILIGIAGYIAASFASWGYHKRGAAIAKLEGEKSGLQQENASLRRENTSLQETVAPLLKQAAKEFPGQEINVSLKRLIERLEADSPVKKPIASATATIEVIIQSEKNENSDNMGAGAFFAFGKGTEALLLMSSTASRVYPTQKGQLAYRSVVAMDASDGAVGKPIGFLSAADYLQVQFALIPEGQIVLGGKIICTFNGSFRVEASIPRQVMHKNFIKAENPKAAFTGK